MRGLLQNDLSPQTEVTLIKRKLKPKEKLFCGYYACTGDAGLSAKKAGYRRDHGLTGERLLCDEDVLAEIERLMSLRRSIAPRIDDALRLMFETEHDPRRLGEMDLFTVSEIKRNRDGMLEIKFFDRLKALEKLGAKTDDGTGVSGLFDAIGRQAEASGSDADD